MSQWRPQEIIVNEQVGKDPVTSYLIAQCPGVPIRYVRGGRNEDVVEASHVLANAGSSMLEKILAGKGVIYIAPAGKVVDKFEMPDPRMKCPHFERLKLASNGCFYQCDWCYLKLTYRAAFPYITVRAEYDEIKRQLDTRLKKTDQPVMFNSGELADSLALEHLTGAAREFIPYFGKTDNGYLFMLSKTDSVESILDLPHNGHTILTWSLNNPEISRRFEIGAPTFERRLDAARRAQKAGYRLRIRLDPIVPIEGWKESYAQTIRRIFEAITPERVTIGTLRFEEGFYKLRNTLMTKNEELSLLLDRMAPMFPLEKIGGSRKPKGGKYSFSEVERTDIFGFAIGEIRRFTDVPIALCKESSAVWERLGMDISQCRCVCQLEHADLYEGR